MVQERDHGRDDGAGDKDLMVPAKDRPNGSSAGAKVNGAGGRRGAEGGKKKDGGGGGGGAGVGGQDELSEEDQGLKAELEMLVERLQEGDETLYKPALESLRTLIRTATSSMTSVPKPLKFLRPSYPTLVGLYDQWESKASIKNEHTLLAEILSVLGMTYSDSGKRECLAFRMKSKSGDPGSWGHDYVRHLSSEIMEEYQVKTQSEDLETSKSDTTELLDLALQLVPFFLKHNAEADAVDLLLDLESIEKIVDFVDHDTYARVCLYMVSCVNLLVPPDDLIFLQTARLIYLKQERYYEALLLALRLGDAEMIRADFDAPLKPSTTTASSKTSQRIPPPAASTMRKQMAFTIARQRMSNVLELGDGEPEISEILANSRQSEFFVQLQKDIDVSEPKLPEDIYKTHLEHQGRGNGFGGGAGVDSARENLSSIVVNGLINAGSGKDKLVSGVEEGESLIYRTKEEGLITATASLGLLHLWNVDVGLADIDKYQYSTELFIKAGALLAIGVLSSGTSHETDPAMALLQEHLGEGPNPLRRMAIVGLGIAYAGTGREDVTELLLPIVGDTDLNIEMSSLAALAIGQIMVGTAHGESTGTILQTMMEREEKEFSSPYTRFMALGLALLYLGKQDKSDATIETLKAIEHPLGRQAQILVEVCSFTGTGNVLKIQSLLHICNDHLDDEKEPVLHQALAVLGIALIAMGEDVGLEMSLRQFEHLMHYGDPIIRQTVPLALGLMHTSNPKLPVLDTLSRYSHDNDLDVATNAIFAMGLCGAGTTNARLMQMLRGLASYYTRQPEASFMVRVAQGLVHTGKGTITMGLYHSDRQILSRVAIAGLLSTILGLTDGKDGITSKDRKDFILGTNHWMLFYLTPALSPRYVVTVDEALKPMTITVRVGQAVDIVGQAGRPKTITGFRSQETPILLAFNERAELATEEYIPVASVMEGVVILRKNPEYLADAMDER